MVEGNHLKKIVIVGASGNVGATTLKSLLKINKHIDITVVTRPESTAIFPTSPQVTVKKGSYDDAAFLESTFAGHDLAMFALSHAVAASGQPKLIDAAAKAGVEWLITNEYGGDGLNPEHRNGTPMYQDKIDALKQVEELAKTYPGLKWIGVTTNFWAEMALSMGAFGIDEKQRTATLWSDSSPVNSTSQAQVGLGIAKLISLPLTSATSPRASLQHYANNFVYLSSFVISQQDVLESYKRVTGTTDADWKIVHSSAGEQLQLAQAAGDQQRIGMFSLITNYLQEGRGGNYEPKAKEDREVLGLEEENLDDIVKRVLAAQGN